MEAEGAPVLGGAERDLESGGDRHQATLDQICKHSAGGLASHKLTTSKEEITGERTRGR